MILELARDGTVHNRCLKDRFSIGVCAVVQESAKLGWTVISAYCRFYISKVVCFHVLGTVGGYTDMYTITQIYFGTF